MKRNMLRWLAIVLILEIGLLHIMLAQAEYEEAAYMGYAFAAHFFGALLAALAIYHRQFWGWMLGLLIAAGSIAGYTWSRTLGMPGMNVEEWFSPYGIVAMTAEGLFLLIVVFRPWHIRADYSATVNPRLRYAPQVVGLLVVVLVGFLTNQWDGSVSQVYGHHVGSSHQVLGTPTTTQAELEQRYGVRVSLVAISMMSSIVDVRLKIIDPEKASALLRNQAALLVGDQQTLWYCYVNATEAPMILAPHMHSHRSTKLNAQKIAVMFFPTQQTIHSGSQVSLVFGDVRTDPFVVR